LFQVRTSVSAPFSANVVHSGAFAIFRAKAERVTVAAFCACNCEVRQREYALTHPTIDFDPGESPVKVVIESNLTEAKLAIAMAQLVGDAWAGGQVKLPGSRRRFDLAFLDHGTTVLVEHDGDEHYRDGSPLVRGGRGETTAP
jgi:hypothetical protein